MIDAVRLGTFVSDPERVAARLRGATMTASADGDGLPTFRGYVGSLRATLKADRLYLRGSLPTFLGHAAPLPRPLVARARERIEAALGIDLGGAHVWGLELTADLPLTRPVGVYLPLLIRRPRLQRVEYEGESVAFVAKVRRLTFYDTVAACRARKKPPPPGDVLRLELQFRKRLARQLGADGPLTLADLHGADWWGRLVARWLAEYDAVEKARAPLPFEALGDPKRGLALVGLGVVGREATEAAIEAEFKAGRFSRSTKHNRLGWLRDLAADPARTAEDERVAELDAAVRHAARCALSCS